MITYKPSRKAGFKKGENRMNLEADFTGWGYREISEGSILLKLYSEGSHNYSEKAWEMFGECDSLKLGFNQDSGYVFLYNEDLGTLVEDNDKLVLFLTCGECGAEGSEEEMEGFEYLSNTCAACSVKSKAE